MGLALGVFYHSLDYSIFMVIKVEGKKPSFLKDGSNFDDWTAWLCISFIEMGILILITGNKHHFQDLKPQKALSNLAIAIPFEDQAILPRWLSFLCCYANCERSRAHFCWLFCHSSICNLPQEHNSIILFFLRKGHCSVI